MLACRIYQYVTLVARLECTKFWQDRREQFALMTREYRHLQMCKRRGRGHDPDGGIEATKRGELAIPCRACPHPGINLPEGWENAPPEQA